MMSNETVMNGGDTKVCRPVLCNAASIWKVKNGLILNLIIVQLEGNLTGILASRCHQIRQKLENHFKLQRIGYALPL